MVVFFPKLPQEELELFRKYLLSAISTHDLVKRLNVKRLFQFNHQHYFHLSEELIDIEDLIFGHFAQNKKNITQGRECYIKRIFL